MDRVEKLLPGASDLHISQVVFENDNRVDRALTGEPLDGTHAIEGLVTLRRESFNRERVRVAWKHREYLAQAGHYRSS